MKRYLVILLLGFFSLVIVGQGTLHIDTDTARGIQLDTSDAARSSCPYRLGQAVQVIERYEEVTRQLLLELEHTQYMLLGLACVLVLGALTLLYLEKLN